MSYHVVKWGGDGHEGNYKEIMMDSSSDLSLLPNANTDPPAAPGSVAYTKDMEHSYLLGPDNVWREV